MLYTAYEMSYAFMAPARIAAGLGAQFWRSPFNPAATTLIGRTSAAALDVFENVTRRYPKPEWGIEDAIIDGAPMP